MNAFPFLRSGGMAEKSPALQRGEANVIIPSVPKGRLSASQLLVLSDP